MLPGGFAVALSHDPWRRLSWNYPARLVPLNALYVKLAGAAITAAPRNGGRYRTRTCDLMHVKHAL